MTGVTESNREDEGITGLQCCWWGVIGDGSVCSVQWLWGSVCVGVVVCDCVSLVDDKDDGSVLIFWLSGDSWTISSAR